MGAYWSYNPFDAEGLLSPPAPETGGQPMQFKLAFGEDIFSYSPSREDDPWLIQKAPFSEMTPTPYFVPWMDKLLATPEKGSFAARIVQFEAQFKKRFTYLTLDENGHPMLVLFHGDAFGGNVNGRDQPLYSLHRPEDGEPFVRHYQRDTKSHSFWNYKTPPYLEIWGPWQMVPNTIEWRSPGYVEGPCAKASARPGAERGSGSRRGVCV